MTISQQLNSNNYAALPGFIDPQRAKDLANEFRAFVKENNCQGDIQTPTSQAAYNYMGFLELLCEMTPEISKAIGEPVLPTYTYARVYHEGSTLERHRDREACEISVTLHLDSDSEWPIFIEKPNGEAVSLNLNSGDGMIYLGRTAYHWREQYQGKSDYVQVFLHYVRSRGECSYTFFDITKTKPPIQQKQPVKFISATSEEFSMSKNLSDYIIVIENVLSEQLCDRILAEYKDCDDWIATGVGTGAVNTKIRNADTIGLSHEFVIEKNEQERRLIDNAIFESAHNAIIEYNRRFPNAHIERDSGYELLRYRPGGFYVPHVDSFLHAPRSVSCSFTLNDDFEGGEFVFFEGTEVYTPPKGSALMFPSNFQYPHEVKEVTKGTRYSIITWFI